MYKKLIGSILKGEKVKGKIDLNFVDDAHIHRLNLKFRKKDKPTDVLSFSYGEDGVIGDVIISKETTLKNAKKYGVTYNQEVKRLVIHGVLHVLGYDHGRKMRDAEKAYSKL
ncbi:MAG: rRNA maturation RNase YbeY [Candidatus Margulisiibacteriota bacterium]